VGVSNEVGEIWYLIGCLWVLSFTDWCAKDIIHKRSISRKHFFFWPGDGTAGNGINRCLTYRMCSKSILNELFNLYIHLISKKNGIVCKVAIHIFWIMLVTGLNGWALNAVDVYSCQCAKHKLTFILYMLMASLHSSLLVFLCNAHTVWRSDKCVYGWHLTKPNLCPPSSFLVILPLCLLSPTYSDLFFFMTPLFHIFKNPYSMSLKDKCIMW